MNRKIVPARSPAKYWSASTIWMLGKTKVPNNFQNAAWGNICFQ